MRRIIALLTAALIAVPLGISCYAEKSATADESAVTHTETSSGYNGYCKDFAEYGNAEKAVATVDFGEDGVKLNGKKRTVSFEITAYDDCFAEPVIEYAYYLGNTSNAKLSLKIDGKLPYSELDGFELTRLWRDKSDTVTEDSKGNQFSPEQEEVFEVQTSRIYDASGFVTAPLKIALSKGKHTVELVLSEEEICIKSIEFAAPTELVSYSELEKQYTEKGYKAYKGDAITVEGEDAVYKNSPLIISLIDRSEPSVKPSDPYTDKINYIGGTNWKSAGDTITWELDVPEDGLYNIYFHFKQTYLQESSSYRALYIDGEIPFEEASRLAFKYDGGWQYTSLSENGDRYVYLTKGKHTLSMRVTLGDMADFAAQLREITALLGDTYRDIVMITGESPDSARDYDLFYQLPELEKDLTKIRDTLSSLADESEHVVGSKGGTNASTLRKAVNIIDQMLAKKYKAHTKVSSLYGNYSSLASLAYEMQDMALDIDAVFLTAPGTEFKRDAGFFESTVYTVKRLISSFMDDYEEQHGDSETVTVWCNWGRDQISVLDSLINSSFTPETEINVNIKITTASVIQANLSGRGPDVMINQSRSGPVNYAMRNAAYDISQFGDYETVMKRFSKTAADPYKYNGGVYGIPETQSFYMMFVRTDIMEELGLEIPRTWENFILASKVIFLNNMEVAIPYTQVTNDAVNAGAGALTLLPTIAMQNGASLYNSDNTQTAFSSPQMLKAATMWTDFYTKYKFTKTYNFFNRFRTGTIPLAIQDYTMYATVSAAAPEITGRWTMVSIPGTVREDGTVDNTVSGSGNAAIILSSSENKDNAWEFLKWYTSDDIQYRFSKNLESVLGVSARRATANVNAMKKLGWSAEMLEELTAQWESVRELPEIPGSYYVIRSIDQVYWNVVDGGKGVREMLKKWGDEADGEISRKLEEYGVNRKGVGDFEEYT